MLHLRLLEQLLRPGVSRGESGHRVTSMICHRYWWSSLKRGLKDIVFWMWQVWWEIVERKEKKMNSLPEASTHNLPTFTLAPTIRVSRRRIVWEVIHSPRPPSCLCNTPLYSVDASAVPHNAAAEVRVPSLIKLTSLASLAVQGRNKTLIRAHEPQSGMQTSAKLYTTTCLERRALDSDPSDIKPFSCKLCRPHYWLFRESVLIIIRAAMTGPRGPWLVHYI